MEFDQVIMGRRSIRGFPADDFPANDVVSTRRPVNDVVNFVGYPED